MNDTKRQKMPPGLWPGLWVIATPIGNLSDLSPRARLAIEAAGSLLCEDTRVGSKLLSALGVVRSPHSVGLERCDAHSTERDRARWIERLQAGESLALLSDAGTPGVSDPGAKLVNEALAAGVRVVPLPGPSAVATLISVAGLTSSAFTFRGFFPRKRGEQERELNDFASASAYAGASLWFDSPQRITDSLSQVARQWPDCRVVAAKELTKVFEKVFAGSAESVAREVAKEIEIEGTVGEWCFVVELTVEAGENPSKFAQSSDWVKALHCLLDARVAASEAARQVSQHFGVARRDVYETALKISGKKVE